MVMVSGSARRVAATWTATWTTIAIASGVDLPHVHDRVVGAHRAQELQTVQRRTCTPAITATSIALCSPPCKVLRFAPTPLPRGLRTLTAPARSS